MANQATYDDANLILRLYELRREETMRKARQWFAAFPSNNPDEIQKVTTFGTQENAYMRMVLSYWEQACAFLNHGLVHEQLFFETSGEFFGVWERVKPVVPKMREMFHQNLFLANLEKAAQRFEKFMETASPGALEAMRQWTQQMRSAKAQKASA